MSLQLSRELMQKRAQVLAQLRSVQKTAKETATEGLGEVREQLKKLMGEAQELRRQADDEFNDHQIAELEREWRSEGDPLPPEVGAGGSGVRSGTTRKGMATEEKVMNAFRTYLRYGKSGLDREELRSLEPSPEWRNVIASKDSKGGYLVVPKFGDSVLEKLYDQVKVRQYADIETLTEAGSLGYPTVESLPDDLDWTTELKTVTDDASLTFGKRELVPHALRKRIKVSEFSLLNSKHSPEEIVRRLLAIKLGHTQENAYINGNGAGQPLGFMIANNQGVSTARDISSGNTTTAITYTGLVKAKHHLKEQYRRSPKCRWLFPRTAIEQLSLIVDGQSRPIWREGLAPGEPDSLLGMPVHESEFMPSTFTTGLYVGVLADFSYYKIVDVNVMPIKRIDEVHYETGEVAFVVNYWGDGMPIFEEAFVRVKLA